MASARITYTIILFGAAIWCSALLLAPVFAASTGLPGVIGAVIYQFFHPICHQLSERSFQLFGHPLAVCARCSSIYFGFLAGTLLYPAVRTISVPRYPSRIILLAAIMPMLVDVAAALAGMHEVTTVSRLISGATFGLVAPFFILPAAIEAVQQAFSRVPSTPLSELEKGFPNA